MKTNVLFFTKGTVQNPDQDQGCTENVWVYDLRTNMPSFGKRTPFSPQHLAPFEALYGDKADGTSPRNEGDWSFAPEDDTAQSATAKADTDTETNEDMETSRWRVFSRKWISEEKGDSLDISWIRDSDNISAEDLPEPHVLAGEAMTELTEALRQLDELMQALGEGDEASAQKKLLLEVLGLESEVQQ